MNSYSLILIVYKSLKQHVLSTTITVVSVSIATGLMMSVFSINSQTKKAFIIDQSGFDAILGARGSQLQLVMNSIYHLETSPGNIPWTMYETIKMDPSVELAIPYAVGDNYKGFRMVGTVSNLFTDLEIREGEQFAFEPDGKPFEAGSRQAVIGSYVAQKTGLKMDSTFNAYHGLYYDETKKHDEEFIVVGVLKPTNTPSDRVIWVPIDAVYRMEGHVLRGGDMDYTPEANVAIPNKHKEVSAVMLKFNNPLAALQLEQTINRQGKVATLAFPIAKVMLELFEKIGWVNRVLELIAYLVVFVTGGSLLASIYNTMNERKREFAIFRALGARKSALFLLIIAQTCTIAIVGTVLGYGFYTIILLTARWIVRHQVGVLLDVFPFNSVFITTPIIMLLVGIAAGILPAVKAYRTDVATNLTPIT